MSEVAELGRVEREAAAVDRSILDLSGDLKAAIRERDRQTVAPGVAAFREAYRAHQVEQRKRQEAERERLAALARQEEMRALQAEKERRQEAEPLERMELRLAVGRIPEPQEFERYRREIERDDDMGLSM